MTFQPNSLEPPPFNLISFNTCQSLVSRLFLISISIMFHRDQSDKMTSFNLLHTHKTSFFSQRTDYAIQLT